MMFFNYVLYTIHFTNIVLGGWMMVGNVTVINESDEKTYQTVKETDIPTAMEEILKGHSKTLSLESLISLKNKKKFDEIRVRCFKPSRGTTVDIVIIDSTYLDQLLSSSTSEENLIKRTHYRVLDDDNSTFSSSSEIKTGTNRNLYNHAFYVAKLYHVHISDWNRMECDDSDKNDVNYKTGHWMYYIR